MFLTRFLRHDWTGDCAEATEGDAGPREREEGQAVQVLAARVLYVSLFWSIIAIYLLLVHASATCQTCDFGNTDGEDTTVDVDEQQEALWARRAE